jgi:glycosyltransferase involved in cell wall biosynthesis
LPSSFNVHLTMNKLMEYMALGKPTIAYDMHETRVTGGDATIFLNGNTAMPLANAIVELADNPDERMRLGEKAKNRVHSMLAWEKQREALACIYKQLMLSKVPATKSAE